MSEELEANENPWAPVPPPGSIEAQEQGCTCAVWDNCYGKGRGMNGCRWGWHVEGGCPLHTTKKSEGDEKEGRGSGE